MKLYTEEQVRKAFIAGMEFIPVDPNKYEQDANEYMKYVTPIELPSDDEIEERFDTNSNRLESQMYESGFRDGTKWMKEQILKQNNK